MKCGKRVEEAAAREYSIFGKDRSRSKLHNSGGKKGRPALRDAGMTSLVRKILTESRKDKPSGKRRREGDSGGIRK